MHNRKVSIIGLGYVGLPVAVAFGKKQEVIAFDISQQRIEELKSGYDKTEQFNEEDLKEAEIFLTTDIEHLKEANFHIVTVPTPIDAAKVPDLLPLKSASQLLGTILKKDDIIVYESTVYPGVTEEVCMPILEEVSGLKGGVDFFLGYSPERINPGDKLNKFANIKKVISGQNEETLQIISQMYSSVINAGVFHAKSIKIAEAAKVIENAQRDINIAFINELSIIFRKLNIGIYDVLEAASTKWNFLSFFPGLVGGHCIGVDPYYLTYKSTEVGYHPEVILAGRRVNDNMGKYIAELTVKEILKRNLTLQEIKIGILGFTFKENCPDTRNTRVIDIYNELKSFVLNPMVFDDQADHDEVFKEYAIRLHSFDQLPSCNVVIFAVAHNTFINEETFSTLHKMHFVVDIKNVYTFLENKVSL